MIDYQAVERCADGHLLELQLGVVHRRLMRRDARGDVLQLRLGHADIGLGGLQGGARLPSARARADASAELA